MLDWLESWYYNVCNGDWEHDYGIEITTIDNPGWNLKVDLVDTKLNILNQDWVLFEESENDWYGYSIKDGVFNASGDPKKLNFLISIFKRIVKEGNAPIYDLEI